MMIIRRLADLAMARLHARRRRWAPGHMPAASCRPACGLTVNGTLRRLRVPGAAELEMKRRSGLVMSPGVTREDAA